VAEVFEAFVDPEITKNFWFTKSTGRLEAGKHFTWTWQMYDISIEVDVKAVEPNKKILVDWGNYGSMTVLRTTNQISQRERIMKKTAKPKDVDAYIAAAPKEVQPKLKEMRAIIKKTAPQAVEGISYGMPYYAYKGRLAYFSPWKKHIGLYIPTPVLNDHKSELAGYENTKATVRFPLEKKLPAALITKLVKARMKINEQH
jgi:uncharacterized protein YdhG (YjbR/CyaY superfamily)